MLLPTWLTQWHQRVEGFRATAFQLLGMNNLKPHLPWPWHEGQDPERSGRTYWCQKGTGSALPKMPSGSPRTHVEQHAAGKHPSSCAVLPASHPTFRARHNEPVPVSQGHRKMLLCWQGDRKLTILPFPPSPAPWGWGSAGKRQYFLHRGLLLGQWECSPSILLGIGTVHSQGTALQPPRAGRRGRHIHRSEFISKYLIYIILT